MPWQARDWIRLLIIEGLAIIILLLLFWWLSRRKPPAAKRDERCTPPPSQPVPVPQVLPESGLPQPPAAEAATPPEAAAAPSEVSYAGWGATAAAESAMTVPSAEVAVPEAPAGPAEEAIPEAPAGPAEEAVPEAPAEPEAAPPPPPDDLKIIEGIGPKIAGVLAEAGITTFAQLATAEVDWLRQVMLAAGLRLADPTTWPEQARLAAAGDWEGLQRLQDALKGGRRAA